MPGRGLSGGLAMFWSQGVFVAISSYSHHHIDAVIDPQEESSWRFTGFYGSPTVDGKRVAWDIFRTLRDHHHLPWLCTGDFNELLSREEKWGRLIRPEPQMLYFRQVVDECGFVDLGFIGASCTWWNRRDGAARVLERLDQGLGFGFTISRLSSLIIGPFG